MLVGRVDMEGGSLSALMGGWNLTDVSGGGLIWKVGAYLL